MAVAYKDGKEVDILYKQGREQAHVVSVGGMSKIEAITQDMRSTIPPSSGPNLKNTALTIGNAGYMSSYNATKPGEEREQVHVVSVKSPLKIRPPPIQQKVRSNTAPLPSVAGFTFASQENMIIQDV